MTRDLNTEYLFGSTLSGLIFYTHNLRWAMHPPLFTLNHFVVAKNQATYRTILDNAMQNSESVHQQAYSEMIRAKSVSEDYTLAQHLADLDMIDSPYMEYTLADYEAANGMGAQALVRIDALVLTRDMSKQEMVAHLRMKQWVELQIELNTTNQDWSTLSAAQMQIVEELAYNDYDGLAGANAQSILNEFYEGEFYTEASTQFTELEPRSLMQTKTPLQKHIEVFPSPAKDFVNIQLHLAQWNNTTLMRVYSSNGVVVYEEKIIDAKQQLILPITEYADGNYHLQIIQNEKQIDEIQFTIAK